jgi:hypothetical protein
VRARWGAARARARARCRHLHAKAIAGEARAQFESLSDASVDYRVGHDLAHHQRRVLHLSVGEITGGEL